MVDRNSQIDWICQIDCLKRPQARSKALPYMGIFNKDLRTKDTGIIQELSCLRINFACYLNFGDIVFESLSLPSLECDSSP